MTVNQIYSIINTVSQEVLGESAVVNEDLSNVVELGDSFENVSGFDNYVKTLTDQIGRMIFVNRVYKGRVPSVLMDGWLYGSILEKVSAVLPETEANEEYELEDGTSYDPNIFYKPTIEVKCYNNRVTFEIPISITEKQVRSSFTSASQLNAFISMIYTAIENAMTINLDSLISRTINNFIGETIYNAYQGAALTTAGDSRAVNLLALYNAGPNAGGTALTAALAMTNSDFIKFAAKYMNNYRSYMSSMSTLFNIGGKQRFTPADMLHTVFLQDFVSSTTSYLQADTFNQEDVKLPNAETVPFWQGSGTSYAFDDISKINVKTSGGHTVAASGILGVMFDRDALGVVCQDPHVTSQYNAKAEFWNEWHKYTAGYFNDQNENFVVFFVA